jgi:hypothetical protein
VGGFGIPVASHHILWAMLQQQQVGRCLLETEEGMQGFGILEAHIVSTRVLLEVQKPYHRRTSPSRTRAVEDLCFHHRH